MSERSTPDGDRRVAVVPAYNESETILDVIEAVRRDAPDYDVVIVDDGSTDDTAALAAMAGVRSLRMPFNVGIGGAVQAGFIFALENGYTHMVQIDGDGQHDAKELVKLETVMQETGVDVACGSRFLTDGHRYPAPFGRRTGIHLFAWLLSVLVGQPVSDPTSGFRLYNRRAIRLFARDYPHDYPEVEAVLMLHHHRLTMREVPVRMYERGGGRSSITSGKSVYYMIKVLLALGIALVRRRPMVEPGDAAPVAASAGI